MTTRRNISVGDMLFFAVMNEGRPGFREAERRAEEVKARERRLAEERERIIAEAKGKTV